VVLRPQRAARPYLGRLLPEQACPQAQLAVPLERYGLGVNPASEDQVAVQAAHVVLGDIGDQVVILGVRDALAFWRQQLDQLVLIVRRRPGGRRRVRLDGHRPPSRRPAGSPLRPVVTHRPSVPR
jgi:hypothetical protein